MRYPQISRWYSSLSSVVNIVCPGAVRRDPIFLSKNLSNETNSLFWHCDPVPSSQAPKMIEENGYYGYADQQAYMEQEEEWEREGLLDPAWEKQQKKVSATTNYIIYISLWICRINIRFSLIYYRLYHPIRIKLPKYHKPQKPTNCAPGCFCLAVVCTT